MLDRDWAVRLGFFWGSVVNAAIDLLAPSIVSLLRQSLTLRPGDPMPGIRINDAVSGIHERDVHRAVRHYMATHANLPIRDLDEIAAAMNEPVEVQNTLGERELIEAQAVLQAKMLGLPVAEYRIDRRNGGSIPINERSVSLAIRTVTDAMAMKQQMETVG